MISGEDALRNIDRAMEKLNCELQSWAEANDRAYLNVAVASSGILPEPVDPREGPVELTAIRYGDAVVEMPTEYEVQAAHDGWGGYSLGSPPTFPEDPEIDHFENPEEFQRRITYDEFYIGPDDKTHVASNGTVICHDHQPKQHRDGKPPWCKTCGRTANNKIPTSKFQGHKKKRKR